MAYHIDYPWDKCPKMDDGSWGIRLVGITGLFLAAFLLMTNYYWPEGKQILLRLLFPGDREQLWAAVTAFSGNLDQGIPLREAAQAFCRELFAGGY